jgi:hypothetical protein
MDEGMFGNGSRRGRERESVEAKDDEYLTNTAAAARGYTCSGRAGGRAYYLLGATDNGALHSIRSTYHK